MLSPFLFVSGTNRNWPARQKMLAHWYWLVLNPPTVCLRKLPSSVCVLSSVFCLRNFYICLQLSRYCLSVTIPKQTRENFLFRKYFTCFFIWLMLFRTGLGAGDCVGVNCGDQANDIRDNGDYLQTQTGTDTHKDTGRDEWRNENWSWPEREMVKLISSIMCVAHT